MSLADDLRNETANIFKYVWRTRDGRVVPDTDSLTLGNDAVWIDGTVLYADLTSSTTLVDSYPVDFSAEVYKSYLRCAARIIADQGGTVTAYDGDRIMAVFVGNRKNTAAAIAALKINYAVQNIINPAIKAQYGTAISYKLRHVVGIDTSKLFVAKTGVRNANDLVWVGRAANYAAKLSALSDNAIYITSDVMSLLAHEAQFAGSELMWEPRRWEEMNDIIVYRSEWMWLV